MKHRGPGRTREWGEKGNRRWGRDRVSASAGRKMVMREAMAHCGNGGPTGYGGQSMAGAGTPRTAMRYVPAALRVRIGEWAGGG